jgi:copper oxidase (laccase) domain-containing protein
LPAAVAALRAAGANDLQAAVGPGICGRCYEVGPEVADQARAAGHVLTPGRGDRWQLDLAASAQRQLAGLGVAPVQVAGACTATTPGLYSYRAQAAAGRQGGVIAIGG